VDARRASVILVPLVVHGHQGAVASTWSHNVWMLVEHPLSLYHPWYAGIEVQPQADTHGACGCLSSVHYPCGRRGVCNCEWMVMEQAGGCSSSIHYPCTIWGVQASRCSCEHMVLQLVDARRASTILVDIEGCVIVSRQSWNRLADARRASVILVLSVVHRHRSAVTSRWSCNL
jgi:hypothetical protein